MCRDQTVRWTTWARRWRRNARSWPKGWRSKERMGPLEVWQREERGATDPSVRGSSLTGRGRRARGTRPGPPQFAGPLINR